MASQELLEEVVECRTLPALKDMIGRYAQSLGYETFNAFGVTDRLPRNERFKGIDTMPLGYEKFLADMDRALVDPVMQHCKHRVTPIMWDQTTYVQRGMGHVWEEMASYGIVSGISVAMHFPGNLHVCFGFDRSESRIIDIKEKQFLLANFQLFAAYAAEPAVKLLTAQLPHVGQELTQREKECLRWTSEGKTIAETAQILGISASFVKKIHQNVMEKLDCVNATQAACKAMRSGQLS